MKTKLFLLAVLIGAGSMISAAPARREEPPREEEKRPVPGKPAPGKNDKRPAPGRPAPGKNDKRPAPAKPAPRKADKRPAPVVVHPAPVAPKAPVVYQPRRNTYTIQLNADNVIIFEQRIIGLRELRDKIRMVKFDRPRPLIIVKVESGVAKSRLDYALKELRAAGFNDVQIVNSPRRVKFAPAPRIPAKRVRR